jgi:hypothetical protein
VYRDAALVDVDPDRSSTQHPGRPGAGVATAQHRSDPSTQLRIGERLLLDIVGAVLKQPCAVQLVIVAGKDDDGQIRPAAGDLAAADAVQQSQRIAVDVDQ